MGLWMELILLAVGLLQGQLLLCMNHRDLRLLLVLLVLLLLLLLNEGGSS